MIYTDTPQGAAVATLVRPTEQRSQSSSTNNAQNCKQTYYSIWVSKVTKRLITVPNGFALDTSEFEKLGHVNN